MRSISTRDQSIYVKMLNLRTRNHKIERIGDLTQSLRTRYHNIERIIGVLTQSQRTRDYQIEINRVLILSTESNESIKF